MANLRIDDTRRVAPGQAPGQFDAPDASRGAQAASRQMQEMGQAVQQAGTVAAGIYTQERERFNETRVNEALNRAQARALENQTEMSQLLGAAAMKVGENEEPVDQVYTQRFDREIGEIADELQLTDEQRRRYSQQVQPLATRFRGAAQGHFAAQATAYQEDVETTTVATAQMAILADPDNAEVFTENRQRITEAVSASGRRLGWTAERTALEVQERTGKAVLDAVIARADEDPRGAQDMLDRHRADMTPAQQAAARNSTAGGLATQDASAWVSSVFASAPPPEPGTPGASFQMPLEGVSLPPAGSSSAHGPRRSFRTSNGRMASSNHDGVDFAAPAGSAVRAVAGGRVVRAGPNGGYGNFVEVDHGNGVVVGYAHLQDFDVQVGDTVAPGQTFARVGSTGNSTGPHLHMRARRNGESIDPATLFGEESDGAAAAPPTGGQRPTRAAMERMATERFGTNPVQLAAARAEIARAYSMEAAEKAEREHAAQDAAFEHVRRTGTMPPASMMANLPAGDERAVVSYLEWRTAPPVVRSDPALLLQLAAMTPEQEAELAAMSPDQIVARWGGQLDQSDILGLVGRSARANAQQQQAARAATVVPSAEFGRAVTSAFREAGLDRSATGRQAAERRQELEALDQGLRAWVTGKQIEMGRQLNEDEIRQEVQGRLARLAWAGPTGMFGGRQTGTATNYDSMRNEDREAARQRLRTLGMPADRIDENAIWTEHIRVRVRGRY